MKQLTKAERELLERRRVGSMMSNVLFNLAQHPNTPVDDGARWRMSSLRFEWDAIETAKNVKPPKNGRQKR